MSFKDYDTAKFLLGRGANVNQRPIIDDRELDYTPLLQAVRGGDSATVGLLIKYGADVNVTDDDGDTPLTIAASNGDTAICRVLLSHGSPPNHKNRSGITAFATAKQAGYRETMAVISHLTISK